AWFSSHRHNPTSGNEFYQYSYLFKYGFDLPKTERTLTLPNEPRIKIFAVSVAKDAHDGVQAAWPLYDTLADHIGSGAPTISPDSGDFNDATTVTINPPLYWQSKSLYYAFNSGSDYQQYKGPFILNNPTTIKAVQITDGK